MQAKRIEAFRASLFHFLADPLETGESAYEYFDDGLLVLVDGIVEVAGEAGPLLPTLPPDAAVFATVHPQSVDAFFEAARARRANDLRQMHDGPSLSRLPARHGRILHEDSQALIARWHGTDRLLYAVTSRFAPTSTERQLELAGQLLDEHAGLYLQTHIAENRSEVAWVKEVFPWSRTISMCTIASASCANALSMDTASIWTISTCVDGICRRRDIVLPDIEPVSGQWTVRRMGRRQNV